MRARAPGAHLAQEKQRGGVPSLFFEDGFERQFVHGVGNPYEDRHRSPRSVVMSLLSKERRYELEKVHWPELHTCVDCGSVGFEMSMWLYTRGGICGTRITDVLLMMCTTQ